MREALNTRTVGPGNCWRVAGTVAMRPMLRRRRSEPRVRGISAAPLPPAPPKTLLPRLGPLRRFLGRLAQLDEVAGDDHDAAGQHRGMDPPFRRGDGIAAFPMVREGDGPVIAAAAVPTVHRLPSARAAGRLGRITVPLNWNARQRRRHRGAAPSRICSHRAPLSSLGSGRMLARPPLPAAARRRLHRDTNCPLQAYSHNNPMYTDASHSQRTSSC